MIKFNKSTLDAEMVQGDTGTFSFVIKSNGLSFVKEGDEIWFTLKKIQNKKIVIQKKVVSFPNGVITIPLEPNETKNLEPDNYIYDLKLVRADGNVDTLIPSRPHANFTLKKGVKENE